MSGNSASPVNKNEQHSNKYEEDKEHPATFESAVTTMGFGKFNIFLILLAFPSIFSPIFETTTMSYIFASVQCDLELSLEDKGYLNSIIYAGMISSAPLWGFLYDTLGRKKLLIGGFLLDGILVVASAFSQSFIALIVCKFLGGLIINGPYAAMTSYLSEFHSAKYRPRVQLIIGTINSFGTIMLPLLAWAILPQVWQISLFNGYINIHPWNIYLLVCSLPAFYGAIVFLFLPESPKFLMTNGDNSKALGLFQKVYSSNTGKPREEFPIKTLVDETKLNDNKHGGHVTANRTKLQALKEGWQQIMPLFYPPYLTMQILVCSLQFCITQSLTMLRLWVPQIFQAVEDYKSFNNGTTADLCTMLEVLKPAQLADECTVNVDKSSVYINSLIVALGTIVGFSLAGLAINFLGKKKILIIMSLLASASSSSIYFAQDTTTTIVLCSSFIALGSVCTFVILAVVVDLFPTTLRTLSVSLTMMVARTGALFGNLIFSTLLRLGCGFPFFYIGILMLGIRKVATTITQHFIFKAFARCIATLFSRAVFHHSQTTGGRANGSCRSKTRFMFRNFSYCHKILYHCVILISSIALFCGILCFFLPNTDNKALK